jgi:predicted AlkP superfamily phosphohydrolase/phosphomutase
MSKDPKVIVIGLDGATWELLKPWVDAEKLPTIKRLMDKGAWGVLKSTTPPVTFPAWECMFTGQNPGKLGVFDFVRVDVKQRRFKTNTTNSFKGEPLWNILNHYGYKTCVVGIPTSKIQPIYGVMVGGPFSFRTLTYPEEYKKVLDNLKYELYPNKLTKLFIETSESKPPLEFLKEVIQSRFKLAEYLINTEEPDFLAFVIFFIDNIQHFFWGESILYQAWKIIDEELGKFVSKYNSIFFIVSDHGFNKMLKTFYLSKFLRDKGLLVYKDKIKLKIAKKINLNSIVKIGKILKLDNILTKVIPRDKMLTLFSIFPDKHGRLGAEGLEDLIDWEKSRCIPLSTGIYLNCPKENEWTLKNILKKELTDLTDLIEDVYYKDEIYSGPYLDYAPDIIIKPKKGIRLLESPFVDTAVSINSWKGWKGNHAFEGIVLVSGTNIKKTKRDMSILDITPTILHIYGISTSSVMDGKASTDLVN